MTAVVMEVSPISVPRATGSGLHAGVLLWWAACALPLSAQAAFRPAPPPAGVSDLAEYSLRFDASRDPERDLVQARAAAASRQSNVLVVVGGDWCVWCFLLDRHFAMDAASATAWYGAFEVMRVYYGDDNRNAAFLARYPDFELFPHFYILAADGRVLGSSTADVMIRDAKYDPALISEFITRWSNPPVGSSQP